jgi:hypothetical protein
MSNSRAYVDNKQQILRSHGRRNTHR